MLDKLKEIEKAASLEINDANSMPELEAIRVKFLGKKGHLTSILRGLGSLTAEERPIAGAAANETRQKTENLIEIKSKQLWETLLNVKLKTEKLDITLPGIHKEIGHLHPLRSAENKMVEIFVRMGFDVVEGPEVESTHNNFDALNSPADHPSRDMTDTFYISEGVVLRTQTSPVQIRAMQKRKPPIRIISPGRVYRCDAPDGTHSPVFHQLEGLVIDRHITLGDLKGTLDLFAQSMFGEGTKTRLRPHNFPFTEPSVEVDFSCFACGGKGCRLCKSEGWIEMLGAGMVHPNVLAGCGIDPDIYSGFAFGMGIDRVAMLKYNIRDLRLIFENDVRLIGQF
ncbi:MAG: phenylalanine--tRNA ligase subunit alpha [Eubacteriales bacterium]|nr:phenylalanine--tRNA ligase subunit alpha [Eubacteriales bacterium]